MVNDMAVAKFRLDSLYRLFMVKYLINLKKEHYPRSFAKGWFYGKDLAG
jgi:hypothetical protein